MRALEFAGTSRFDVRRRIGAGGMGVVYEAFDRQRGMRVAIKTLSHLDPAALYRFKKEFRSLADIVDENLVRLHELIADDDEWFFTMDLVAGVDFLAHVWGSGPGQRAEPSLVGELDRTMPASEAPPVSGISGVSSARAAETALRSPCNEAGLARLRGALAQLASAVDAVHRAGKLHRDVKPANILVEAGGRLVLLDFGIAADVGDGHEPGTDTNAVIGTPAYMAPEQAHPQPVTEAADWYAVGVVLFEALTGQVPFTGPPIDVLVLKQSRRAPRASSLADGVPPDLDALCAELLATHPSDRPTGPEILRRTGGGKPIEPAPLSLSTGPVTLRTRELVGRGTMLTMLRMALDAVRHGRSSLVHVVGRSGMGKSTLVRHFLADVERSKDTVVLTGRCYERESVPYKGFDALIDALTRHLSSLPATDCASLVPRDARALARVFPVLDRVAAFANAPRRASEENDPQKVRSRAFVALRELFARLADRGPVILYIDDLQWGDADSAALLAEITVAPDPPPLLFIVAYRTDGGAPPWLDSLARTTRSSAPPRASSPTAGPFRCRLAVDALDPDEALTVASRLLGVDRTDHRALEIAAESGGSPFFIGELAHFASASADDAGPIRLEHVVEERLRALPPAALRVLQLVAVAGHPIPRDAVLRTGEISGREGDAAIALLRAAHLLRTSTGDGDRVEAYHDRIRETVLRTMPDDERRATHGRLADARLARGESDPDMLFSHFEGAGLLARAAEYAEAAGGRASVLLAFDRAAEMYERALELTVALAHDPPSDGAAAPPPSRAQALRVLLADALARAGRGASAADAYIAAANGESGGASLDLLRKASEQLLFSGHIDRGLDLVRQVLAQGGMRLASSPLLALLGFLVVRVILLVRGTNYRERRAADVPAALLDRIDTCAVVANGLAFVDNVQGKWFQGRAFLLALRAGEPSRLLHALCGEAIFRAADGVRKLPRAVKLLDEARGLAVREGVRDQRGTIEYGQGMVHHITGNWREAAICFDRAESLFSSMGESFYRVELDGAQSYGVVAQVLLGNLSEATRRHGALRREADDRGDLFLGTNLCIGFASHCWLYADEPNTARTLAAEAMARWSPQGFHIQHWHELLALSYIDLYDDEPDRAVERVTSRWPALKASMLLHIEFIRLLATHLRAMCNLALAARSPSRTGPLLKAVEVDASTLAENGARWAAGVAALMRAGSKSVLRDQVGARRELEMAINALEDAGMGLFVVCARRRMGELVGGESGAAMVAEADTWMMREGVRKPARVAAMMAPGFAESAASVAIRRGA